jgi:hypothetical protein
VNGDGGLGSSSGRGGAGRGGESEQHRRELVLITKIPILGCQVFSRLNFSS